MVRKMSTDIRNVRTAHPDVETATLGSDIDGLFEAYEKAFGPVRWGEQLRQEALFGFREIAGKLRPGMRVLEIGAGTGVLAHLLAKRGISVDALEPLGPGFAEFGNLLGFAQKQSVSFDLINSSIEHFRSDRRYDLVFSVNVFEHVRDWRLAIRSTVRSLAPGGQAIILCPNYNVPYEPHFGLPIIVGKRLTQRVFRRLIEQYEEQNDAAGLWESLNFIRASEVKSFCLSEGIPMGFDKAVTQRLFARMFDDPQFRKRRGRLGPLIGLAYMLQLPKFMRILPLRLQPYVRMVLSQVDQTT
jgi:2-polyprenyl-3-methyl-5-hydroxy-6-metoxy-1,4-benzoquinol methylase